MGCVTCTYSVKSHPLASGVHSTLSRDVYRGGGRTGIPLPPNDLQINNEPVVLVVKHKIMIEVLTAKKSRFYFSTKWVFRKSRVNIFCASFSPPSIKKILYATLLSEWCANFLV